jgi:hypothetical protein
MFGYGIQYYVCNTLRTHSQRHIQSKHMHLHYQHIMGSTIHPHTHDLKTWLITWYVTPEISTKNINISTSQSVF